MCFCGRVPVEEPDLFCDACDAQSDGEDWWVEKDRQDLLHRLDYLAGLIALLGGGKRRDVQRALHLQLGCRRGDANYNQLYEAIRYAERWVERLR